MAGRKNTITGSATTGSEGIVSAEQPAVDPASFGGSSGGSDGGSIRDAAGTEFDPAIHVGPDSRNNDGSFRRKRGRKAGSGSHGKAKVHSNLEGSIEALTKGLAIFHIALATATKTPELVIEDSEAKSLATATVNVLDQYDIRPDPKIEAIIGLIGVSCATYIPRYMSIKMRKEQERKEKAASSNGAGVAGIYDAEGNAMGTTGFNVVQ
jgi:hypothetical protein